MRYSVQQIEGAPGRLGEIPSAPKRLRICGNVNLFESAKALGIVGTRKPTEKERELAFQLGASAAARGWLVVSGLALGIDGAAHQGAITEGQTGAFLGSGLANISPRSHRPLAAKILEANGFLASEIDDEQPARPQHLIARNRLISGLAAAVVVISSGKDGGTMYTARFAAQQSRPVFCPQIEDVGGEGVGVLLECPQKDLGESSRAFQRSKLVGASPLALSFTSIDDLLQKLD